MFISKRKWKGLLEADKGAQSISEHSMDLYDANIYDFLRDMDALRFLQIIIPSLCRVLRSKKSMMIFRRIPKVFV